MADRQLTVVAAIAGVVCCVGTAAAAVALGGVALASLGRFGIVSATTLVVVVAVAWLVDARRAGSDDVRIEPDRE